jgi:hypothetical protein
MPDAGTIVQKIEVSTCTLIRVGCGIAYSVNDGKAASNPSDLGFTRRRRCAPNTGAQLIGYAPDQLSCSAPSHSLHATLAACYLPARIDWMSFA